MIVDKLIPTKLSSKLIPYYENLEYEIPRWVNPINNKKYVKKGTIIWVSTLDLPEKSNHVIEAQCDYCEEIYTTKRSHISDPYRCACTKCSTKKAKDTMIKMYGVDNAMRCQQFVDKFNFTIKKKYGVNNIAELDGIKEKRMQTCTERYQVPFPLQNNAIKEKSRLTCLEKYGVQYSFLSPDVQNKIKNASVEETAKYKKMLKQKKHLQSYLLSKLLVVENYKKLDDKNVLKLKEYAKKSSALSEIITDLDNSVNSTQEVKEESKKNDVITKEDLNELRNLVIRLKGQGIDVNQVIEQINTLDEKEKIVEDELNSRKK